MKLSPGSVVEAGRIRKYLLVSDLTLSISVRRVTSLSIKLKKKGERSGQFTLKVDTKSNRRVTTASRGRGPAEPMTLVHDGSKLSAVF